jgi:hypothetical protein
MAVCNKTGAIAIYNEEKNLFMSPYADGPINFHANPDGTMNIKNLTKFGRSFSLLRIPYSFKLLIQELQVMNIQMRIITDENIDQLLSMSYSNNINKLLHNEQERSTENMDKLIKDFAKQMTYIQQNRRMVMREETPEIPSPIEEIGIETMPEQINIGSKVRIIRGLGAGQIAIVIKIQRDYLQVELSGSRQFDVRREDVELLPSDESSSSFDYRMYENDTQEGSIPYAPFSPAYVPGSQDSYIPYASVSSAYVPGSDTSNFIAVNQSQIEDQVKTKTEDQAKPTDILEVPETKEETNVSKEETDNKDISQSVSGEKKVIEVEDKPTSSSEIKKINI